MIIEDGIQIGSWCIIEPSYLKTFNCGKSHRMWICKCCCGTVRSVDEISLKNETSVSCGCYNREITSKTHTRHGHCKNYDRSPEHSAWQKIKERCNNPNNSRYKDYGGRGIKICDLWNDSFEAFIKYVGHRPSGRHSIERIDNDGHYEPGNVRWATTKEQARNKRTNRFVELPDGRRLTYSELSRECHIPANTLRFRLINGWSLETAITEPVRVKRKKI